MILGSPKTSASTRTPPYGVLKNFIRPVSCGASEPPLTQAAACGWSFFKISVKNKRGVACEFNEITFKEIITLVYAEDGYCVAPIFVRAIYSVS